MQLMSQVTSQKDVRCTKLSSMLTIVYLRVEGADNEYSNPQVVKAPNDPGHMCRTAAKQVAGS